MNLQCPNCQKTLTVGDQYAGQLMKCPLCNGTFTVPSLPPAAGPGPVPPPAGVPPAPPTPAGTTYSFEAGAPPVEPAAKKERPAKAAAAPTPPPPAGYEHTAHLDLKPTVLQYIVVVGLVLVFILLFFTWVGLYAGKMAIATQSAWQAAFGGLSITPGLEAVSPVSKEDVGVSTLMIFYVLLFIVAVLLAIASLVVTLVPLNVPAIKPFLPWRWAAVGGLSLLTLLFFILQLVIGFSLEHKVTEIADKKYSVAEKAQMPAAEREFTHAEAVGSVHRTGWLRLALVLQIIATVCAGLLVWLERRGNRAVPRVQLLW